jgi:hypothetical protein
MTSGRARGRVVTLKLLSAHFDPPNFSTRTAPPIRTGESLTGRGNGSLGPLVRNDHIRDRYRAANMLHTGHDDRRAVSEVNRFGGQREPRLLRALAGQSPSRSAPEPDPRKGESGGTSPIHAPTPLLGTFVGFSPHRSEEIPMRPGHPKLQICSARGTFANSCPSPGEAVAGRQAELNGEALGGSLTATVDPGGRRSGPDRSLPTHPVFRPAPRSADKSSHRI